jgi:predicted DNA-binding transcriptional regulator YafY
MPLSPSEKRSLLTAMRDPDQWVVRLRYKDAAGKTTIRIVSPIRLEGASVMALCLAREQCRRLILNRISHVELIQACDVLMPVPIVEVTDVAQ